MIRTLTVAALLVLTGCAVPTAGTPSPASPATAAPAPAAPAATAEPTSTEPDTTFDDGLYEVGADMPPGKYKTPGSGSFCYWDRSKEGDGSLGDIIQQEVSQGGPQTATVKAGDYFKTSGCGTWTKQ